MQRLATSLAPSITAPIAALVLLTSALAMAQVTVSFQDNVAPSPSYVGTRGVMLSEPDEEIFFDPNASYGAADHLGMDGFAGRQSALLRWDLSSLAPGSTVTSASITVNVINDSEVPYPLREILTSWKATEVTWRRAAVGKPWSSEGASAVGQDIGSINLGELSGNGVRTVVLNAAGLAMVQRWIDTPSSNNGVIFQDYTREDGVDLSSAEASVEANRPLLRVTYGGTTTSFQQGNLPSSSYSGMTDATIGRGPAGGGNLSGLGLALAGGSQTSSILLSFDLSSIPSVATVTAVDLTLTIVDVAQSTFPVYEALRPWTESGATWTTTNGTTPWSAPGASGGADHGAAVLGFVPTAPLGPATLALNSAGVKLVQEWVSGDKPNLGFVMVDPVAVDNAAVFLGRESLPITGRPSLRVSYTGAPAPDPGPDGSGNEAGPGTGNGTGVGSEGASAAVDEGGTWVEPANFGCSCGMAAFNPMELALVAVILLGLRRRVG